MIAAWLAMVAAKPDLLVADFEGPSYGSWVAEGMAFGDGPAQGTLPGQMPVTGFVGKGLVNTFRGGDASVGQLTSSEFRIDRRFVAFRIGGGRDLERLAIQLVVNGKVVRRATGPNDRPGGSEALREQGWDVREFAGMRAKIRIIDQATGGWGHINLDQIRQTDARVNNMQTNATRTFNATARYLNLPIKNGAPMRRVTLSVDGVEVVRNNVELADGTPDWWAPMDIGPWHGKSLSLQVDELAQDSQALRSVTLSDEIPSTASLYSEPLRGQIHFSPRRGWNNDPNGLVYFNGEYHLFFQHNPYGWRWENMHWGHAVSPDLVHWHELGDVLFPDAMGPMFSGSAVVDWHNTSGLGKPGKPPLVLFYTAAGDPTVQCLAYSLNGRDFTKYAHNPIIPQVTPGNRDPKVMWHEPTKRWVMVLYVEVKGVHTIQFFTSPNLRDWTFQSQTDGFYECPDLFELAVDGNAANRKWVLMAASGEYRVGSFDGVSFHAETPMIPLSRGKGFYAPQTFSDIPASDGRRIQIGWFQTETPGMPFNQSMTLPTELTLVSTDDGPRLSALPVRELASLRSLGDLRENVTIRPGDGSPQADVAAELVEFEAEFEPGEATKVLIEVRGATIEFDLSAHEISVNGHRTPIRPGPQHVRVFVDRIGLEVFADDGLTYIPMPFLPSAANLGVAVKVEGGEVKFSRLGLYELKSAWQKPGKHPAGG